MPSTRLVPLLYRHFSLRLLCSYCFSIDQRNQRDGSGSNSNRGGRSKRLIRGKGRKEGARPGPRKAQLVEIAATTLQAVERGNYELDGTTYDLKEGVEYTNSKTKYYAEKSNLVDWETARSVKDDTAAEDMDGVMVTVSECSTLVGIQNMTGLLQSSSKENKMIGVLNFASAKNPGGGFIKGASAQVRFIFLVWLHVI